MGLDVPMPKGGAQEELAMGELPPRESTRLFFCLFDFG
jgi:hypothetical protein